MTDELREEAKRNTEVANKVYDTIQKQREAGVKDFDQEAFGIPFRNYGSMGFSKTLTNVPASGKMRSKPRMQLFADIAQVRGWDTSDPKNVDRVAEEFETYVARRMETEVLTSEVMRDGLEHLYVKSAKPIQSRGVLGGIDLECNSLSATRGRIIEAGVSGINMKTGEKTGRQIEQLYNIPKITRDTSGTGAVDVHGIRPSDLEDNPDMDGRKVIE